ncbi:MAG: NUDIX hydrolase [Gemmatimonadetes bacterium]|nr:NUDIX hydrolase [Gemmatimonadota bacterium]MYK41869.1 NUDIX hydrolase [Gemmatimonadota bacterium]
MRSSVRYGISAAALIVQHKRLLLVNHRKSGQYDFWLPPGGKLQGNESIFDCARREAMEETGLSVELDRIVYIIEYVQPDYHFCKFFIHCKRFAGTPTLANKEPAETFLVNASFLAKTDLRKLDVRPTILQDRFWDDLEAEFPETRYLGLEEISSNRS